MRLLEVSYLNDNEESYLYQDFRKTKKARRVAFGGILSASTAMITTIVSKSNAQSDHFSPAVDSLSYALLYHSGDFVNGYFLTLTGTIASSVILPKAPFKTRLISAGAFSTALLLFAEIPQFAANKLPFIGNLFGTPDVADIPAGLLGVAAATSIALLARKIIKGKSN